MAAVAWKALRRALRGALGPRLLLAVALAVVIGAAVLWASLAAPPGDSP